MGSYTAKLVLQCLCSLVLILGTRVQPSFAQSLISNFYATTCPAAQIIVQAVVQRAVADDPRDAASLIRLFFHDCFATGCDASVLLDNSSTIVSEKYAKPNLNSLRGYGIVDNIKESLEANCPGIVSCADILALSSRESVVQAGGPWYDVLLGRRDSIMANETLANTALPSPASNFSTLISKFAAVNLSLTDLVTLSGAHTIGKAHCSSFSRRLYNESGNGVPDPSMNPQLLSKLQSSCPSIGSPATGNTTLELDEVTPTIFDNQYYKNLLAGQGILGSDELLFTTPGCNLDLVNLYASDQNSFFQAFTVSMTKMGNINPLTGTQGEIRRNCHVINC